MSSISNYGKYGKVVLKPKVREHKSMVYLWMAYWPWSLVFTILNNPVRKIYRHIYNSIHTLISRESPTMFGRAFNYHHPGNKVLPWAKLRGVFQCTAFSITITSSVME